MLAITITMIIFMALFGSGLVHSSSDFGNSLLNLSGHLYSLCFKCQWYWRATVSCWQVLLFFPAIFFSFTATPFTEQAVPTSLAHTVLPAWIVSHIFLLKYCQSFQITQ